MTEKQIIEMLAKQNQELMGIIRKFAERETDFNVVVNSYNGSQAEASTFDKRTDNTTHNITSRGGNSTNTNTTDVY